MKKKKIKKHIVGHLEQINETKRLLDLAAEQIIDEQFNTAEKILCEARHQAGEVYANVGCVADEQWRDTADQIMEESKSKK